MQFEKGKSSSRQCIEHVRLRAYFISTIAARAFLVLGKMDLAINDATTAVSHIEPDE